MVRDRSISHRPLCKPGRQDIVSFLEPPKTRSGGPYRMLAKNLQGWLSVVTWEQDPDTGHWYRLVDLVQTSLSNSNFPKEFTCHMVVLLTKGNDDCRGIELIEVLWKNMLVLIKCFIKATITYHHVLHGFQVVRVMGTASLEANMLQHLT